MGNRKKERHFISVFLSRHNMTPLQLSMVYRGTYDALLSETLIMILIGGGITHPRIARRIVELCGGGEREFDSIVAKRHRGTWSGRPRREKPMPKLRDDGMDILMIDETGAVVKEFESLKQAAADGWTQAATIGAICRGIQKDDFRLYPYTWRRRRDFNEAERRRIVDAAILANREVMSFRSPRLRDRVTMDGETRTIAEWAERFGVSYDRLRWRLQSGVEFRKALTMKVGRKKGGGADET